MGRRRRHESSYDSDKEERERRVRRKDHASDHYKDERDRDRSSRREDDKGRSHGREKDDPDRLNGHGREAGKHKRFSEDFEDRKDRSEKRKRPHAEESVNPSAPETQINVKQENDHDVDATAVANGVESSSLRKIDSTVDVKPSLESQNDLRGNTQPPQESLLEKAKKVLEKQKAIAEKLGKLKKQPQLSKVQQQPMELSSSPKTSTVPVASQLSSKSIAPVVAGTASSNPSLLAGPQGGSGLNANFEAVKRAQEYIARLGFQQPPGMPFTGIPGLDGIVSSSSKTVKAPVLRLDAHGREIDEHGNVIEKAKVTNVSTLKVNINKQKKEAFQILHPDLEEDLASKPFYDDRMGIDKKKLARQKRPTFQFVEEGRWSKQAEIMRLNSQFGEAKAKEIRMKQVALAKAKVEADINPNLIEVTERFPIKEEKPKDQIPDVEWWDAILLPTSSYKDVLEGDLKAKLEKITIYVEHPVPIEPPAEPAPPPPQPLKLTKKEQKKLRTQRRLAREKEKQEMIQQGLLPPPKPKVKMSNMMKVLGAEATQDPTRVEQEIRSAAAEREQAHVDRNLARKLTPSERRDKKEKKLFEDSNILGTIVSVYKINDLSHPQTRYKVDINAQENRLSGCMVISDAMTVVVVEGVSKSIKRYSKLMLKRINWAAAVQEEAEEDVPRPPLENKCYLVWQGTVARPSFDKFLVQKFRTAAAARKFLQDAGVAHYWDLAANYVEE